MSKPISVVLLAKPELGLSHTGWGLWSRTTRSEKVSLQVIGNGRIFIGMRSGYNDVKDGGMVWSLVLVWRWWNEGSGPGSAADLPYCSVYLSESVLLWWRKMVIQWRAGVWQREICVCHWKMSDIVQKSNDLWKWLMLPIITRISLMWIGWQQTWLHNYTGNRHETLRGERSKNPHVKWKGLWKHSVLDSPNEAAVSAALSKLYFASFLML